MPEAIRQATPNQGNSQPPNPNAKQWEAKIINFEAAKARLQAGNSNQQKSNTIDPFVAGLQAGNSNQQKSNTIDPFVAGLHQAGNSSRNTKAGHKNKNHNRSKNPGGKEILTVDELTRAMGDGAVNNIVAAELDNSSVQDRAVEMARERFEREKAINKGIFGKIASIFSKNKGVKHQKGEIINGVKVEKGIIAALRNTWKHELNQEGTISRYAQKIMKTMRNDNTLDVNDHATVVHGNNDHNISKSTTNRLEKAATQDGERYTRDFLRKGERVNELVDEQGNSTATEVRAKLIKLAKEVNNKGANSEELRTAQAEWSEYIQELRESGKLGLDRKGHVVVDNMDQIGKQLTSFAEHRIATNAIEEYFNQTRIYTGHNIQTGLNTKEHLTTSRRIALKLATTAVGGAVGGFLISQTSAKLRSPLRAALGGAVGGGAVFGAWSGYNSAKINLASETKKQAKGEAVRKGFENKTFQPRKVNELLKLISGESLTAQTASAGANSINPNDPANQSMTPEASEQARANALVDLIARKELGNDMGIDLLAYSGANNIESERLEAISHMVSIKRQINGGEAFAGIDSLADLDSLVSDRKEALTASIAENNVNRRNYTVSQVVKRAIVGGLTGAAIVGVGKAVHYASQRLSGNQPVSKEDIGSFSLNKDQDDQSITEYLNGAQNKMSIIRNDETLQAGYISTGTGWKLVENDGKLFYRLHVSSSDPEKYDVDKLTYLMSPTKNTVDSPLALDIDKNGFVTLSADSDIAKNLFRHADGNQIEFIGKYGEVVNTTGDGHVDVLSRLEGTDQVEKFIRNNINISGEQGSDYIQNNAAVFNRGDLDSFSEVQRYGETTLASGKRLKLFSMDDGYDPKDDPFNLNNKSRSYNFGASAYDPNLSEAEQASKVFENVAKSPEQIALWRTALGMHGEDMDSMDELNHFANVMIKNDNVSYNAISHDLMDQLKDKLSGGRVESLNLSATGYTRSLYNFLNGDDTRMAVSTAGFAGNGHGLTFFDSSGHNILDNVNTRKIFNIPADAEGTFAVRLDCGGQIVWVPKARIPDPTPHIPIPHTPDPTPHIPIPHTPDPTPHIPIPHTPDPTPHIPIPHTPDPTPHIPDVPRTPPYTPPHTPDTPPVVPPYTPPEELIPKNIEALRENLTPKADTSGGGGITREAAGELTTNPSERINDQGQFIETLTNTDSNEFAPIRIIDANNPADTVSTSDALKDYIAAQATEQTAQATDTAAQAAATQAAQVAQEAVEEKLREADKIVDRVSDTFNTVKAPVSDDTDDLANWYSQNVENNLDINLKQ